MKNHWSPGDWWPARVPDPHAEFYSKAVSLAVRIQSPFLALWRLTVFALVAMAITVLVWIGLQVSDRAMPVRDVRTALLTPDVPPLGRVKVHFDLERMKICAVDISASIIDGKDDIRPLVTLHRDAAGPLGADHFTRSFKCRPRLRPARRACALRGLTPAREPMRRR